MKKKEPKAYTMLMSSRVCVHTHIYIYKIDTQDITGVLLGFSILLLYRITAMYILPQKEMKQCNNLPKAESSVLLEANLQFHTKEPKLTSG